jgi:hypothetical protein
MAISTTVTVNVHKEYFRHSGVGKCEQYCGIMTEENLLMSRGHLGERFTGRPTL